MLIEVQFRVTDGPVWKDGMIVHAAPLGGLFTAAEILAFPGSLPADWNVLDAREKGEHRYAIRHTRAYVDNDIATIATVRHGAKYTGGSAETRAAIEAEEQKAKDAAQRHWDMWTGTGPGEGVGIDTNWGSGLSRGPLTGLFGIIMADVPQSSRFIREFAGAANVIDHTADPLLDPVSKRRVRWRVPYETFGIPQGKIDNWKTPGKHVALNRSMTPRTLAEIRGVIP